MGNDFVITILVRLLLVHGFMTMSCSVICSSATNLTDQEALLAFKSQITFKSDDPLVSNWTTEASFCTWVGVSCSSHRQRVTALNLSFMGFQGTISPYIGNLSFLTVLDLRNNSIHGQLPETVGHLRRLRVINLRSNHLEGKIPSSLSQCRRLQWLLLRSNRFQGNIPKEIAHLSHLEELDLSENYLTGTIPSTIFNMSTLKYIDLVVNNLSGGIPTTICHKLPDLEVLYLSVNPLGGPFPASLCNCTSIRRISFNRNGFIGSIPADIGCLSKLEGLRLAMNRLTGTIPLSLGNLSRLEILDFMYNYLDGGIPQQVAQLSRMRRLRIAYNNLSGGIPEAIFNLTSAYAISFMGNRLSGSIPELTSLGLPKLNELNLRDNRLNGKIPNSISNASRLTFLELSNNLLNGPVPMSLGSLRFLRTLNLQRNQLSNDPSERELHFLSSLTGCRDLINLVVGKNPINGVLPKSIGNLSSSLELFSADASQIKGSLPITIGNLSNLLALELAGNDLIGTLPSALGSLGRLQRLRLFINKIEGPIPDELCNLRYLGELLLHENKLSGPIPNCIGNLSTMQEISLSSNALKSIPLGMWNLNNLWFLNLSLNSITGYLPPQIENLKMAETFDLSKNQLSGSIPGEISNLKMLRRLNLSDNAFQGSIPDGISELASLESLDLSSNKLSGNIPESMEKLRYLKHLNLSLNMLSGKVPTGGPFRNFTDQSFVGNASREEEAGSPSWVQFSDGVAPRLIPYHELLSATNNFCEANLLGVGSFGSVYKGTLSDNTIAAVKVLDLQVEGALKSFDAECEVLRNVRHRNLVKIISSCSNLDFRALVLQYMPNGSLERMLYSYNYFLDLPQRLNIMIDVATAVEYLHHGYSESVVHCDLKPSNVLLDEEMVAHVNDFGIAKIFAKYKSMTQTATVGTMGYIAPEYGSEGRVSTKGDVYSYGIMLMETFTRKKPTHEMFVGGLSLRQWVDSSFPDLIMEVVDANLLARDQNNTNGNLQTCLLSIMGLGLQCSLDSPEQRLDMKEVVVRLSKIRQQYISQT
ncbi:Receptor kinase-like protein Xa21 [Vitis vinifera]|uniref:non-specific serine/threonine protein kinase n=1 Tax=Vitis vinifera TaxID=29760 RepID=A0A438DAQ2_VITVI|nr:Receptor kinase-like protein Xa21 [Vitis vinifera]